MIDHYEAEVKTAQDYYPFGMIMPGRMFTAISIPGGSYAQTTTVNGYSLPVDLTVNSRTGATPSTYTATHGIDLTEGFESGTNDDVTAYIVDTSFAGGGNGDDDGSAIAGTGKYRYGFNGKEKDDEVKGAGDQIDYGMRVYDPRNARWFSLDPLQGKYPGESNYAFVSNSPILFADKDGKDKITSITIINKDGTTLQIQRIDKGVFHYGHDATYDGFGVSYKQDIVRNLTIDNRNGGNTTVDEVMKNPNNFNFTTEYKNMQEISLGEYLVGLFKGESGENEKARYGFIIYANGNDPEWNEGLPRAADGNEILDLKEWLEFAGDMRSGLSPADLLKEGKLKEILEKIDRFKEAAEKTAAAVERIKKEIEKRKHEAEIEKDKKPDSAECPYCSQKQDSSHIDQVNGAGSFQKLKNAKKTDKTKDEKTSSENH